MSEKQQTLTAAVLMTLTLTRGKHGTRSHRSRPSRLTGTWHKTCLYDSLPSGQCCYSPSSQSADCGLVNPAETQRERCC